MMSVCRTLHAFLGFQDRHPNLTHCQRNPTYPDGLSLIAYEFQKPANVLESSAVKPPAKPPAEKKYPPVRGFYDASGEGLRSCTESLGFESSDETEANVDEPTDEDQKLKSSRRDSMLKSKLRLKRSQVTFPPPLPSLNRNGNPSFFLKPVRKDGRFLLTEVKIERPEILRASREDGRLRLQLVGPRYQLEKQEEVEEEEEEIEEIEEERESVRRRWKVPSRCHVSNSYHPLWNNTRCVTST